LDKPWHPECFKCAGCGSPFSTGSGGGSFMIRDDRPYCQGCTDKTLGSCAGCGGKLTGAVLTALDRSWHPACFVCAGCKKAFTGGKFKMSPSKPGVPYCDGCVNSA
jgi:paxillin